MWCWHEDEEEQRPPREELTLRAAIMSKAAPRMVIQPFKPNQAMDEEYAKRTWQTLHDAIK